MEEVQICAQWELEVLAERPFDIPTAVISIGDPGSQPPTLRYQPQYLLRLEFDDAVEFDDAMEFDDAVEIDGAHTPSPTMGRGLTLEQAEQIAAFVYDHKDNVQKLICQCGYGCSRSAAVAAAVRSHFLLDGPNPFTDRRYRPSIPIFSAVSDALGWVSTTTVCHNRMGSGLDVYDWVLSPEIREFLRPFYGSFVWEKAGMIQGGCRPVEEQRAALNALLEETEDGEDRESIQALVRMHGWCLEELRRECPGQVFLFLERGCQRIDELSWNGSTGNVAGVFHNYDEFMVGLDNFAADYDLARVDCVAYAEKWVMTDGKMKAALGMNLYTGGGRLFIQRIWPWDVERKWEERIGNIPWQAERIFAGEHWGAIAGMLPLPFRNGDLVQVDIPDLEEPIYGVLNIAELDLDRYRYLLYIEDHCLRQLNMSYTYIGVSSGWRIMDWTHPATPAELPAGQEILVELSDYLHRLEETDEKAARELYLRLPNDLPLYHPGAATLEELLEVARTREENRKK